ncbi:MAG: hypothetical protein WCE44_11930 [Candidatus Velthaea sp.]|jgi:hypothetical protein
MRTLLVSAGLALASGALLGAGSDPSPPAADASPTPLKQIGRVRTSVCSTIVVHANSAIDDALANDAAVRSLAVQLATANIADATDLAKRKVINAIENAVSKLRETALAGEGEVRRLRQLAADSPEPRKTELRQFADAIGGALYRQRMIAIDTQRLIVIQQGRESVQNQNAMYAGTGTTADATGRTPDPVIEQTATAKQADYDQAFKTVAADIVERSKLILSDEGIAADHGLGATTGC